MFCSPRQSFAAVAVLLALAGCTREKNLGQGVERIAVPGLENLSDPKWDWIGAVSTPIAVNAVVGSPKYFAAAGTDAEALRARYKLLGYYEVHDGHLRMRATLRDIVRQSNAATAEVEGETTNSAVLVNTLMGKLVGNPRDMRAPKPAAVEAYGRAQLVHTAEAVLPLLRESTAADPGFLPAVSQLGQFLIRSGKADEAKQLLQAALATGPRDWDAIALKLLAATAEGNAAAVQKAAEEAAAYWPNDTTVLQQLAGTMLVQKRYGDAMRWLRKATELEPTHTGFWNQLGYAQAYAGAAREAADSAAEYRRIAPNDPNAYDTSGEIAFYAGDFREAEKQFLESQLKSPQFLRGLPFAKAAFARFFAGDTAGADGLFQRYLETRRSQQDPLTELRMAHWLRLTGRGQQALEMAEKLSAGENELAGRAAALRALWLIQDGHRDQAAALVRLPQRRFASPSVLGAAVMTAFLAQPHAADPQEWLRRAAQGPFAQISAPSRNLVVAYAMVLDGHAQAAAAILSPIWQQSQPADNDELRVILGSVLLQLKDRQAAAQLLRGYPLPPQPGEAVFASLYLPQYREWRKAAGL